MLLLPYWRYSIWFWWFIGRQESKSVKCPQDIYISTCVSLNLTLELSIPLIFQIILPKKKKKTFESRGQNLKLLIKKWHVGLLSFFFFGLCFMDLIYFFKLLHKKKKKKPNIVFFSIIFFVIWSCSLRVFFYYYLLQDFSMFVKMDCFLGHFAKISPIVVAEIFLFSQA